MANENIPTLNEWAKGVSNAIREKSGKSDLIKPLNWADEIRGIEAGGSGGLEINGLIEEYKVMAGETINAGDFIEFVNNVYKELNSKSYSSCAEPSCVLLEPNKIFIAHAYSSNSKYLYGTIVEINGTEMSATSTQLDSTSYSCYLAPSCCLISNNKVFIAHSYGSSKYLYGTIVEIDGNTMTPTSIQLNGSNYSSYLAPSCCLIENNKVFIVHSYSSSKYLYGTIVEINGTEMTPTSTQLNSSSSCNEKPSCCLVDTNKVFITNAYGTNYFLNATLVTIDGNTMTATNKTLDGYAQSCYLATSCCLLEPNKVFITYVNNRSGYNLYGAIVIIEGTNMTYYPKKLNEVKYSAYVAPSCVLLENNKVFIAHGYGEKYYLYGTVVNVEGTTMTATSTEINGENNSCSLIPSCLLLDDKIFIAHAYGDYDYLYGTIYFGDYVKQITNKISGIAKTSGTEGQTIEVYVPNKE